MTEDIYHLFKPDGVSINKVRELLAQGRRDDALDQMLAKCRQQLVFTWSPRCGVRNGDILDLLDLDRPGLEDARKCAAAGDRQGALEALKRHFRERKAPRAPGNLLPEDAKALGELREKALRGDLDKAMEPMVRLRLLVACQAHAATGEARFARAIDRLIPALAQEPRLEELMDFFYEASAVEYLLRHEAVSFERVCDLIVVWYHYAEQVNQTVHLPEPSVPELAGNHYFWMTAYGLVFAMMFPEFKRSEALQLSLWARMADELSRQVNPDGSMIEAVPHYEDCCTLWVTMPLHFARANDRGPQTRYLAFGGPIPVPDLVYRQLERMYRFVLTMMRPDRRCVALGDSENDDVFSWHQDARGLFPKNRLIQSLLADRNSGPADVTSVEFPYAGYYVMRSGWEPEALYLMLDAGRFGQGHHHEDKLHVEVMAFGRPFLVDAGRFTYDYSTKARQWAVLSAAHNTILVDGVGQCRWQADRLSWYNTFAPVNDTRWHSCPECDFAAGKYDLTDGPFEKAMPDVERIERAIYFRKPKDGAPGFWIVSDIVRGTGAHSVEELFHFHPDHGRIAVEGRRARTANPDANLMILALGKEPVEISCYRGQEEPFRGWFSESYGKEIPAEEVHFQSRGPLPLRRDLLLLPYRGATPPKVVVEGYEPGHDWPGLRLKLLIGGQAMEVRVDS